MFRDKTIGPLLLRLEQSIINNLKLIIPLSSHHNTENREKIPAQTHLSKREKLGSSRRNVGRISNTNVEYNQPNRKRRTNWRYFN